MDYAEKWIDADGVTHIATQDWVSETACGTRIGYAASFNEGWRSETTSLTCMLCLLVEVEP